MERNLNVYDLIKLEISFDEDKNANIQVTKIEVLSEVPRPLSAISLSMNNGLLYSYGGNTGEKSAQIIDRFVKNCNLIIIDPDKRQSWEKEPSKDIKGQMMTSGSSSHWFDPNTLVLIGGADPPLGNRGRSIIAYSSYQIDCINCNLANCIFEPGSNCDGKMFGCDNCDKWVHKVCDKKIKQ